MRGTGQQQSAGLLEEGIRVVDRQELRRIEILGERGLTQRFIDDRSGRVRRTVFPVGAAGQDGDAVEAVVPEMLQRRERDLLIAASFARLIGGNQFHDRLAAADDAIARDTFDQWMFSERVTLVGDLPSNDECFACDVALRWQREVAKLRRLQKRGTDSGVIVANDMVVKLARNTATSRPIRE